MKINRQSVCVDIGDKPVARFKFSAARNLAAYLTADDADVDGWDFQVCQGGPAHYHIRAVDPGDLDHHGSPVLVGWL